MLLATGPQFFRNIYKKYYGRWSTGCQFYHKEIKLLGLTANRYSHEKEEKKEKYNGF